MDKATIFMAILGSGGVWAVVNTVLAHFIKRADERHIPYEEFTAHGKALRGLLYGELEKRCTKFIQAGGISAGDLNDLRRYYYEPYKDLHGDGTIDSLFGRVEALPLRDEGGV